MPAAGRCHVAGDGRSLPSVSDPVVVHIAYLGSSSWTSIRHVNVQLPCASRLIVSRKRPRGVASLTYWLGLRSHSPGNSPLVVWLA